MAEFIRARSEEQKGQRMQQIKDAVDELFTEKAYHEITLTTISEKLNCTRASLYQYVSTKEEIFLEICSDKRDSYYAALKTALPEDCGFSADVFAEVWASILNAHRDHLRYCDILSSIIETNVSIERLGVFKKRYYTKAYEVADLLVSNFGLDKKTAYEVLLNIHYHAVGIDSMIRWNPRVVEALKKESIDPPTVHFRENMRSFIQMNLQFYCSRSK